MGLRNRNRHAKLHLEGLEDRCVPSNSAVFSGLDTATSGSWQGVYGGTGYSIQGVGSSLPSQDKVTLGGTFSTYNYANPTDNLRGLQYPSSPGQRIEGGWFDYAYQAPHNGFNVTLKVPGEQVDAPPTPMSLYVQDWDNGNRSETIQPFDARTGAALAPPVTVSNFHNGVYVNWMVKGQVLFDIEKTGGVSAELSAVFLGGAGTAPTPSGTSQVVGVDTTTGGNWQGHYGTQGYNIYGAAPNLPSFVSMSTYGDSVGMYTFANPSDARGLTNPDTPTSHIAVAKYAASFFTVDMNLSDGLTHNVSFFALDYDGTTRSERIDVIDNNTGAVLASQTVSNFSSVGQYATFAVSGHVQVRFTTLSGPNAVLEGMFFDPGVSAVNTLLVSALTKHGNG